MQHIGGGGMRIARNILVENPERKNHLGDLGIDGRIYLVLRCIMGCECELIQMV